MHNISGGILLNKGKPLNIAGSSSDRLNDPYSGTPHDSQRPQGAFSWTRRPCWQCGLCGPLLALPSRMCRLCCICVHGGPALLHARGVGRPEVREAGCGLHITLRRRPYKAQVSSQVRTTPGLEGGHVSSTETRNLAPYFTSCHVCLRKKLVR